MAALTEGHQPAIQSARRRAAPAHSDFPARLREEVMVLVRFFRRQLKVAARIPVEFEESEGTTYTSYDYQFGVLHVNTLLYASYPPPRRFALIAHEVFHAYQGEAFVRYVEGRLRPDFDPPAERVARWDHLDYVDYEADPDPLRWDRRELEHLNQPMERDARAYELDWLRWALDIDGGSRGFRALRPLALYSPVLIGPPVRLHPLRLSTFRRRLREVARAAPRRVRDDEGRIRFELAAYALDWYQRTIRLVPRVTRVQLPESAFYNQRRGAFLVPAQTAAAARQVLLRELGRIVQGEPRSYSLWI